LHTDLSTTSSARVAYGKRYFAICPERFIVKVPLYSSRLPGARKLCKPYPHQFHARLLRPAQLSRRAVDQTEILQRVHGRLNSFVADSKFGSGDNVGEKATLATQRELLALRRPVAPNQPHRRERSHGRADWRAGRCRRSHNADQGRGEYEQHLCASHVARRERSVCTLNTGVVMSQFAGDTLWTVTPQFKDAVSPC